MTGAAARRPPNAARRRGLVVGLILILAIGGISIAAPLVVPRNPNAESVQGLGPDGGPLGPGRVYLLGTDEKGRDVLSRLIYGGRVTFFASVVAVALATFIGAGIGLLAAASRSAIGNVLMRVTDIGLAIPGLLLAAAIAAVLRSGVTSLTIALAAVFWAPLARVTYGQAVVVRERQFVDAARALGASEVRIMLREVLPHVVPVVAAYASLSVGWAALFESGLGFLGVGVQEPTASIGAMLRQGLDWYRLHPGLILFPTLYLGLLVTGATLIGEGVRRAAPRRLGRRRREPLELAPLAH